MLCKKCPHHVRHGQVAADKKSIEFKEKCGLKMKEATDCIHHPFPKVFDYTTCDVYKNSCKSRIERNDVVPTKDIQYSDAFSGVSITDMELL